MLSKSVFLARCFDRDVDSAGTFFARVNDTALVEPEFLRCVISIGTKVKKLSLHQWRSVTYLVFFPKYHKRMIHKPI